MNYKKLQIPLFLVLSSLGLQSWLSGQNSQEIAPEKHKEAATLQSTSEFLRIRRDAEGNPVALQTAIVRYRNKKKTVLVDLIGAVHIGEAKYYKQLNHQFDQYESLLYELVAPQGTRVPRNPKSGARSTNPISLLQSSAQSMLGLASQLEQIDYQKKHFVHADLSPAELKEKMAERGDNALTLGLSAMADMIRQQNLAQKRSAEQGTDAAASPESLLELMGDPLRMKQVMAEQFASTESLEHGLGPKLNQLIVTDRNAAAMKVLQREILDGKAKIGLFYGAAHMPDFEKRLMKDLGLEPGEHVWVDAWDLTQSSAKTGGGAGSMLMKLLEDLKP